MPIIPYATPGLSALELQVNRSNTSAFIAANPSSVTLVPRTRQTTGEGTVWIDGTPRPVQTVRIIDQSSGGGPTPGTTTSADGQQRRVDWMMVGEWNAEFGQNDRWTGDDGATWEVTDLLPFNGYERRAMVVRYGE